MSNAASVAFMCPRFEDVVAFVDVARTNFTTS
jgi:hypothetical protein